MATPYDASSTAGPTWSNFTTARWGVALTSPRARIRTSVQTDVTPSHESAALSMARDEKTRSVLAPPDAGAATRSKRTSAFVVRGGAPSASSATMCVALRCTRRHTASGGIGTPAASVAGRGGKYTHAQPTST